MSSSTHKRKHQETQNHGATVKRVKTLNKKSKQKRDNKSKAKSRKKPPFVPYFPHDRFVYENSWLDRLTHPSAINASDCGYVVYALVASDHKNSLYVGSSNNLQRRWNEHAGIKSGGGQSARRWIANGTVPEPVCIVQGFASHHDALCFEKLVQKLRFKQFIKQVPLEQQWQRQKDAAKRPLKLQIRKLLVALKTNRWKDQTLRLVWFNPSFRPAQENLNLSPSHSEVLHTEKYVFETKPLQSL